MGDVERRLPFTLAAAIQSIFIIMGFPEIFLRPCAMALDKWKLLSINPILILLGLLWNTRTMTVGITPDYRKETIYLLTKTWHEGRQSFDLPGLEELIGKVGRIGQGFRPIYHLMPMMYASVAYALRENGSFLYSTSKAYRKDIKRAKQRPETKDDEREINFAIGQTARQVHSCQQKYRIPASLTEEISFLRKILLDNSISLCTPLAHIVPRDPTWTGAADSCKHSGGGWSVDLLFWWHVAYPQDVVYRACLPNNKSNLMISINVLEMVCVIINLAAAIFVCDHDKVDLSMYPIFLNLCDNMSSTTWVNKNCKYSLIGRRLARFFIGLLMGTNIGIQAEWLSTHANFIADDISRLKDMDGDGIFDYSALKITYPCLQPCRQFQPSHTLLGMIWDILLRGSCPDPLMVAKLKSHALGQFIS